MSVHIVLASYFSWFWEVVNFLEASHSLIKLWLYVTACPAKTPLLLPIICFSESVILHSVANQLDSDVVVVFEVVTLVSWFIRSDTDWINIGPEYQVSILIVLNYCRWLHLCLFKRSIKLGWFFGHHICRPKVFYHSVVGINRCLLLIAWLLVHFKRLELVLL